MSTSLFFLLYAGTIGLLVVLRFFQTKGTRFETSLFLIWCLNPVIFYLYRLIEITYQYYFSEISCHAKTGGMYNCSFTAALFDPVVLIIFIPALQAILIPVFIALTFLAALFEKAK